MDRFSDVSDVDNMLVLNFLTYLAEYFILLLWSKQDVPSVKIWFTQVAKLLLFYGVTSVLTFLCNPNMYLQWRKTCI